MLNKLINKIVCSDKPVTIILGAGMTVWLGYPDFKELYINILKMLLNYGKLSGEEFKKRISEITDDISQEVPKKLEDLDVDLHNYILEYIDNDFANIDSINNDIVSSTTYIENKKFVHLCNISKHANIITTNYDRAYEHFAELNDIELSNYVKIHGDLESKKVLFERHYEAFILDDEYRDERDLVRDALKNHIVVYLGYSFSDENMRFLYKYSNKEDIFLVSKETRPNSFLDNNIINIRDFNQILPILSAIESSLLSRAIQENDKKYYFLIKEGLNEAAAVVRDEKNLNVFDLDKDSKTEMRKYKRSRAFQLFAKEYILSKRYDDAFRIGYKYEVNKEFINSFNEVVQKNIFGHLDYILRMCFYVNNSEDIFSQIKTYKNYYKPVIDKNLFIIASCLFDKKYKVRSSKEFVDITEKTIDLIGDFNFKLVVMDRLLNFCIEKKLYTKAREVLINLVENFKSTPRYYVTLTELYYDDDNYQGANNTIREYFVVADKADDFYNKMIFYRYHIAYCLAQTYDDEYEVFMKYKVDKIIINDAKIYACWYNELYQRGLFEDAHEMLWKAFEYDPSDKIIKEKVQQRNMGINSGDREYRSISNNFDMLQKILEIEKNNLPKESGNYFYKLKNKNKLKDITINRFKSSSNWFHFLNIKFTEIQIKEYKQFLQDGKVLSISESLIGKVFTILLAFSEGKYIEVIRIYEDVLTDNDKINIELLLFDDIIKDYDIELLKTIIGMSYYHKSDYIKAKQVLLDIESNYYALIYFSDSIIRTGFVSNENLTLANSKLKKAFRMRKSSLNTYYLQGIVSYGLGHLTTAESKFSAIRARAWLSKGEVIDIYYKLIICAIFQGVHFRDSSHNEKGLKEMDDRLKSYLFEIVRYFNEFDGFNKFDHEKVNNIYGYGYFYQFVKSLYWMGNYTKNKKVINYIVKLVNYYSQQSQRFKELAKIIDDNIVSGIPIVYEKI